MMPTMPVERQCEPEVEDVCAVQSDAGHDERRGSEHDGCRDQDGGVRQRVVDVGLYRVQSRFVPTRRCRSWVRPSNEPQPTKPMNGARPYKAALDGFAAPAGSAR